ncbi:hypothetical protein IFR04_007997 [Cadophora malorum]|uniref:Uncharacterized protein n=1 Tax=Cadophora malorum TaxID=108018 RepID=A0A8H7WA71_9HELO|nr:hypothetical protein IFR04_007997 [Cadophora malorum]
MLSDYRIPFKYEFEDNDRANTLFGDNMKVIWRNSRTGIRLKIMNGQGIYSPAFKCRLPEKDLADFSVAECRRRWRDARTKDAEDKAAELNAAYDAALSAAADLQV